MQLAVTAVVLGVLATPPAVAAGPPFGNALTPCQIVVLMFDQRDLIPNSRSISNSQASWAHGWFTARDFQNPHPVGLTLSDDTLQSMVVDQCRSEPNSSLLEAVIHLYDRLATKGM
jgi:hypothetical protein